MTTFQSHQIIGVQLSNSCLANTTLSELARASVRVTWPFWPIRERALDHVTWCPVLRARSGKWAVYRPTWHLPSTTAALFCISEGISAPDWLLYYWRPLIGQFSQVVGPDWFDRICARWYFMRWDLRGWRLLRLWKARFQTSSHYRLRPDYNLYADRHTLWRLYRYTYRCR